jgi:phosphoribosylglycinamide formyltransferase-1
MPSPSPSRLAVLASGRGSNLQAIIEHFDDLGREGVAKVVLVASNRADAPALLRAATASIDIADFDAGDDGTQLLALLRKFRIDLVVLAGYLKRIPSSVIAAFAGRILNVHPALLPAFGGEGMYGARVHQAVLAARVKQTGVTVHLVDDDYDQGPIVAQWIVPVLPDDDAEALAARVLQVEHVVYPRAVEIVAALHRHGFVRTG